jgi:hypothetical protein
MARAYITEKSTRVNRREEKLHTIRTFEGLLLKPSASEHGTRDLQLLKP